MSQSFQAQKASSGLMYIFGTGSIAIGVKNSLLGTFLLVYFNQVLGLPAYLAASAMGLALVVDAISDPLVGIWSDRVRSRFGRRHPFMYAAIIPFAFSYYFILQNPGSISEGTISEGELFQRLLILMVIMRLSMTFYEIPRGALAPELTKDYDQRNQISGIGMAFGWVGGAGMASIAYRYFFVETPDFQGAQAFLRPEAFQELAFWGGLAIFISSVISCVGTHKEIPHLHVPKERSIQIKKFLQEGLETISNRSWIVLFFSGCVYSLLVGLATNAGMYHNLYFWQWTPSDIAIFPTVAAVSVIVSALLAGTVARGKEKKNIAVGIFITTIIVGPLPIVLRLLDPYFEATLFPANGTDLLWWLLLIHYVFETCLGALGFIFVGSMVMEIVEDVERTTGRREEGLLGTVSSFIHKLIGAGGVVVSGFIISAVGFDISSGATIEELRGPIINRFATIHVFLGASLPFISTLLLLLFKIDRKGHLDNVENLGYVDK